MQQQLKLAAMALAMTSMVACSDADENKASATFEPVDITTAVPTVLFTPDNAIAGKPSGPITISYRIIGKAVVGRPVAVELRISSSLGNQTMQVAYRTNDTTALRLAESEPRELSVSPTAGSTGITQQVTVIPMREGRLFLNVSVSVETENGSMSTVTAVPIQVGEAPRAVEENGRAMTDENGEAVRALPAQE